MAESLDLSIFDNVEVSDPSCKDKILLLLEEMQEEDEEFIQTLVQMYECMHVTWEQPWYQQTGWLTRKLEQNDEKDKFLESKMCKSECEKVHKNWLKFIKKYHIPNKPICLARWRNKNKNKRGPEELARKFVISYLARGLRRNLNQIFNYFVANYGAPNKGKYSDLEMKIIQSCIFHFPKDGFQIASRLLSREPRGIYAKIASNSEVSDKELYKKKVKWTLPFATTFLKLLMNYSGYSLEELKYKRFPTSLWKNIEKDMQNYFVCLQRFWYFYLHVQLFVKSDVKIKKLRKKIFKVLQKYPYEVWTDINWKEIQQHFPDGMTHNFLYDTATRVVIKYENYLTTPIAKVIEFGLKKITMGKIRDRRLKNLALNEDNELEVISYKKNGNIEDISMTDN